MRGRGATTAAPTLPGVGVPHSGVYYPVTFATGFFTGNPANGVAVAQAMFVGRPFTVATIGLEITTAGAAGALIRLGIYADDGTGYPGALVIDAGTIDGTQAPGGYEVAVNQALGVGQVWFVYVMQGAPVAATTVRTNNTIGPGSGATTILGATNMAANQNRVSVAGGPAGALPATFPAGAAPSAIGPRLVYKVA